MILWGKRPRNSYGTYQRDRTWNLRHGNGTGNEEVGNRDMTSQSLEMIVYKHQRDLERNDSDVHQQAADLDQNIMVTHQIDQTSQSSLPQSAMGQNSTFGTSVNIATG